LNASWESKNDKNPKVVGFQLQKKSIFDEIKKLREKIKETRKEWDDRWYKFEDQTRLLKYIEDALSKISRLKKQAEREKKRKEKEDAESDALNTEATPQKEEEPYAYEIFTSEWLNNYFRTLVGGQRYSEPTPQSGMNLDNRGQSKLDEDLSKGLIKKIESKEDEFTLGISGPNQSKKKAKGPKVSKREQKLEGSNLLTLDIGIIQKIKDVGLNPPVRKDEINSFMSLLEKTNAHYKLKADNKKKGIDDSNNPMPNNNQAKPQTTQTTKVQEAKVIQNVKLEEPKSPPKKVDSPQKTIQKEEKGLSPKKRRKRPFTEKKKERFIHQKKELLKNLLKKHKLIQTKKKKEE